MYSYEDRIRVVELYIKLGKRVRSIIRQLGYPTKNALKGWYRENEQRLDLPVGYAGRKATLVQPSVVSDRLNESTVSVRGYMDNEISFIRSKIIIPTVLLLSSFCAYAQSVETLDGLVKIPLDIFKSRVPNSPTIVYSHGCSGYDNFDVQKARLFRDWGYNVVVAELTRGRGLNNKTGPNGRNITCTQGWQVYPVPQRSDDLIAVGKWVLQQEWHKGKLGAIGFSLGGGAVEFMINDAREINPFSAGVSFYPFCRYPLASNEKTLPNQFHIGTLDEAFERCINLNKQENRHKIFVYENATHSFDTNFTGPNRSGYLYDKESTRVAFERVKTFFDSELKQ